MVGNGSKSVGDFVTGHIVFLEICMLDSSSLIASAPEFGGRILNEMMKVIEATWSLTPRDWCPQGKKRDIRT